MVNLITQLRRTADRLYQICDTLVTVPYGGHCRRNCIVNWGGCGAYAAEVAKALQALGVECWGLISGVGPMEAGEHTSLDVILHCDWRPIPGMPGRHRLIHRRPMTCDEWNDEGVFIDHVMVQFAWRGRIWTHDVIHTTSRRLRLDPTIGSHILPGSISVPELVAVASVAKGWNTTFPRKLLLPMIRRTIRDGLSADKVRL